jgi:type II secretory pathway pseudopilin PulG
MTRCRRFVTDQDGFTLVAVTITMMVLGLFAVSAWAAANNALPGTTADSDSKRAYEAAEAGVQWYQFQIQRDTNYWTKCADTPNSIYLKGGRPATSSTTGWRNVPGSQEAFALELMGNTTNDATCEADPGTALLTDGVLTVRSTGRFNGKVRQIVAKFRRAGFIDYIYYTKRETLAPAAYGNPTDLKWAQDNCDTTRPQRKTSGLPSNTRNGCTEIQFKGTDVIKGPVHTEDASVWVCGSTQFGSSSADKVEIAAATSATNWYVQGCSGTPYTPGTVVAPSKTLDLPKNNLQLASQATLTVSGQSCLQFNGATLTVYSNQDWDGSGNGTITCGGTQTSYTLGANTVIWVANKGGCTDAYDYLQKYNNSTSCGDVAVWGNYSTNVTVGAEDDIIVKANLTKSDPDAMMGLVANQFVRVYHPVNISSGACSSNNGGVQVSKIEAAILATQGSFLADNWYCGNSLGNLTVNGAITQYWRGTVGTSGGNGYVKDYNYDTRLRYREPPNFLDPTTALWSVMRQSEQAPVLTG